MSSDLFRRRRARAVELLSRAPHAEELLGFYVGLVELQAGVASRVPGARWRREMEAQQNGGLRLQDLPLSELEPFFDRFLGEVEPIGTDVIASAARSLQAGSADARMDAIRGFIADPGTNDFLPRAFLEAIARALLDVESGDAGPPASSKVLGGAEGLSCPMCSGPPQVGVFRDVDEALGKRFLVCAICATEWGFPRLTCAHCGETSAERLPVHQAESLPHVRVEECQSCGRYQKAADLRKDGSAEPVVDEIATVELDLWARERGLLKIQPNVLGL